MSTHRRAIPSKEYTANEASTFLDVAPATVRKWLKGRFLKGEKRKYGIGRRERWFIKGSAINDVLREVGP